MKILWTLTLIVFALSLADAKKKKKVEGDFEFADEDEGKPIKLGSKKRWIYDPDSELCRPLSCKKKELCLLEDAFTALCASKKDVHRNGDIIVPVNGKTKKRTPGNGEDGALLDDLDDEDDVFYDSEDDAKKPDVYSCEACPVTHPVFLCGSDNRTYSSLCRLDYHNCLHQTSVRLACKGFCPCKEGGRGRKRQGGNRVMSSGEGGGGGSGAGRRAAAAERKRAQYHFTPEDFKYDNKHYKYIKYTKYNEGLSQKKQLENSYNDALESEDNNRENNIEDNTWNSGVMTPSASDTRDCKMDKMADRLLDWFSVLMVDSASTGHSQSAATRHTKGFPSDCKAEVRWMFAHLDSENDGVLSAKNLYSLRHDEQERCLKPFIAGCDGDSDGDVTRDEWCGCLQRAARPCLALARAAYPHLYPGAYIPACDSRGFYRPLQCHPALGVCWCVDVHGVERPDTRTKGTPHCPAEKRPDVGELISDDEDTAAGSGDSESFDF